MGPYAIEARGLIKRFGGTTAVDGVDLRVPEGSITGMLGPNGAGKTTLLRMLLGIIDPDEGSRTLLGSEKPLKRAHEVGYLPEERGLYQSMKAVETIAFMGALRHLPLEEGRKRGRVLMEEAGLGHAIDKKIRELSKGMAQTVQLLGTIVHRPGDLFHPCHRPCRTPVRKCGDCGGRQGALRRQRGGSARPAASAGASGNERAGRPLARGLAARHAAGRPLVAFHLAGRRAGAAAQCADRG